ncbi:MAG TPA: hypothetical protein VGL72_26020 [Bryobacteraceae bacterium]|jgi:hypothetical protein
MAPAKTLLLLLMTAGLAAATLPVYLEDSHAGSFYWIVRNLNLTSSYELVLVDAHSDATEIADSDLVRQKLLESAGTNQLDALTRDWRRRGVIQCFNWIEPLLPRPISRVWWVQDNPTASLRREIQEQINAHEMTRPRREGDLSGRFALVDWKRFRQAPPSAPTVASVDLDSFNSPRQISPVLDALLTIPKLQAITIAISRPYLESDEQAHALVAEVIRYFSRVVNTELRFEPFETTGDDWSRKAKQFYSRGLALPRYRIEEAPPYLRTLILQNLDHIRVEEQTSRWAGLLTTWRCDKSIPKAGVQGRTIRWKALLPARTTYNLTGEAQGFADRSPKYVTYIETPIEGTDNLPQLTEDQLIPYLDPKTGLGTLRIYSEVSDGTGTWLSGIMLVTRTTGRGYPARLTEIFNLPYVYGSALLNPDTRNGADCAGFIIYGRRREGAAIPYVNPQGLLPYLEELDEFQSYRNDIAQGRNGAIIITDDLLARGMLLHFGKHIAAIYEGAGQLKKTTKVVHQLEGYPEITTFDAMTKKYPRIQIMTFK